MDSQSTFFRPGGTLEPGAECYIARKADEQLLSALLRGEYVFLLDSRQKGKSSLIARSILMLREAGVRQVKLDLQRIGANVTPEQWYAGLAVGVGQELGLHAKVLEYWQERQAVGPLARFIGVLQDVILPNTTDPLVIFVDEVDFVRALTFPTDEFFAAIRESFNRRSSDESFKRLTFCLVGVATPGQLIRNPDISPFNIGVRIDLTDFTLEETLVYSDSLNGKRDGAKLVARVHYWVSGHPYLTQLLCGRIASEPGVVTTADVDRLVRTLFLSPESRQREPNLSDVERRMLDPDVPGLTPEERRIQVLELYGRMLRAKAVEAVEQNPVVATLRLSGVGLEHDGVLQVRNRVYRTVFDETWRQQNLPDAEVRRQTGASRRATFRTAAVASVVVFAVAVAAVGFFKISRDRETALAALSKQSDELRQLSYVGLMASLNTALQENRWSMVSKLTDQSKNDPLRGWEWGHVAKLTRQHVAEAKVPPMSSVFERDPDGSLSLITKEAIFTVVPSGLKLRRKFSGPAVLPLYRQGDLRLGIHAVSGRYVLRDANTDQIVMQSNLSVGSFDGPSKTLIVARGDMVMEKRSFDGKVLKVLGTVDFWRAVRLANGDDIVLGTNGLLTRRQAGGAKVAESRILPLPTSFQHRLCISPDETLLTDMNPLSRARVRVLKVSNLSVVATLDAPPITDGIASFSPDNSSMLVSSRSAIVRYEVRTGKSVQSYPGHKAQITQLEFLPDGVHFASVDRSGELRIWPVRNPPVVQEVAKITDAPQDLLLCDDPDLVLYPTASGALESRNLRTGLVSRLPSPAGMRQHEPYYAVCGSRVFVGTAAGQVDRFSADGLKKEGSVQVFKGLIYGMRKLMNGKRLLVRSNTGPLDPRSKLAHHTTAEYAIVDTETMTTLHRFVPEWPQPGVNYVGTFTSDQAIFGTAANVWFDGPAMPSTGEIRLVSAETGKMLQKLRFPSEVHAAALTTEGSWLIVALSDQVGGGASRVELYDTRTGARLGRLESPGGVRIGSFYRKSDLLIGSLSDNTLAVWHLTKTGKPHLLSPGERITHYAVSPDRQRVVTALSDGNAVIWDSNTGRDLLSVRMYSPSLGSQFSGPVINRATFSIDGTRLLTYSQDEVMRSFNSIPWKAQPMAEAKKGP